MGKCCSTMIKNLKTKKPTMPESATIPKGFNSHVSKDLRLETINIKKKKNETYSEFLINGNTYINRILLQYSNRSFTNRGRKTREK